MLLLLVGLFAADQNVTGVVKDAAGKPVAGAVVSAAVQRDGDTPSTVSDATGRFSLPQPRVMKQQFALGGLVAFHPGHGIAVQQLSSSTLGEREMTLGKPARTRVSVLDSHGKPVSNAALAVTSIRMDAFEFKTPPAVAKFFATKSDAAGVAVVEGIEPKQIVQLQVEASNSGTQIFSSYRNAVEWRSVQLLPTTTIKGKLEGAPMPKDDDVLVLSHFQAAKPGSVSVNVESRVRPNQDGTFSATAVANGHWGLQIPSDRVAVQDQNKWASSAPGAPDKVWTLLAKTPIAGVVQTKDGKPIDGASVRFVDQKVGAAEFTTDASGRYSGLLLPGTWSRNQRTLPDYQPEKRRDVVVEVKAAATTVELPPIVMIRAATVSGKVVDHDGKPAAKTRVLASCRIHQGNGWSENYRFGQTNDDGSFVITGITNESAVTIRAFDGVRKAFSNAATAKPDDKSVTVKLDPSNSVELRVTATDESGKPIDEVEFRTEIRGTREDAGFWLIRLRTNLVNAVRGNGGETIALGPVPKHLNYQVTASAEGFTSQASTFVPGKDLTAPIILRLKRTVSLSGRVVDTAGKPIADVTVKPAGVYGSRIAVETDSDGRFQLDGLSTPTAVVVAHKDGWRHGGGVIRTGEPATIIMKRPTEPAPLKVATEFRHAAAMKDVAKRLSEPLAETVFGPKAKQKHWWMPVYSKLHTEKFQQHMEDAHWSESDRNYARRELAENFAASDFEESLALTRAITDPTLKAAGFFELLKRIPTSEKERRRTLLAETLAVVRSFTDPGMQTLYTCMIGEALFLLGDPNGEKLIRESAAVAEKFARDGWQAYAVGAVAESLSLLDFEAAMRMTKDLPGWNSKAQTPDGNSDGYRFNDHRGGIAFKLAAKQPANAEKAFDTMNNPQIRSRNTARVCHRMAPVDLPRAKRIAAYATDPSEKASCLAQMAAALGPNRRQETLPLLRECYAVLAKGVNDHRFGNVAVALALLDVVVAVAPDDAEDFFWQSLAMSGAASILSRASDNQGVHFGGIGIAALLAQRFDETAAVALAESLRSETAAILGQLGDNGSNYDGPPLAMAALLAMHPDVASDVLVRWPAPHPDGTVQITADRARVGVPSMLLADPARRNERILERYLNQWAPGKE